MIISDSQIEHGKYAVGFPRTPEVWTLDTYENAKTFALSTARSYSRISVYLWGDVELEPDIPMLVSNPGYKKLY
jgi:hypothetical protein